MFDRVNDNSDKREDGRNSDSLIRVYAQIMRERNKNVAPGRHNIRPNWYDVRPKKRRYSGSPRVIGSQEAIGSEQVRAKREKLAPERYSVRPSWYDVRPKKTRYSGSPGVIGNHGERDKRISSEQVKAKRENVSRGTCDTSSTVLHILPREVVTRCRHPCLAALSLAQIDHLSAIIHP